MTIQSVFAQQIRFMPGAGFTLGENFRVARYKTHIAPDPHLYAALEYRVKKIYSLEFLFQRQSTKSTVHRTMGSPVQATTLDWYLLGGVHYAPAGKSGFSKLYGLYAGAGTIGNKMNRQHFTRLAAGAKFGILYELFPHLGVRVQSQMLVMFGGPAQVWLSPPGNGRETFDMIVQLAFTGGLVISFGKKQVD